MSVQVAESGGWTIKYHSMNKLDRALDKDIAESHRFLEQRAILLEAKKQNPMLRMTSSTNLFGQASESVTTHQTRRMGLKAPKSASCCLQSMSRGMESQRRSLSSHRRSMGSLWKVWTWS